MAGLLVVFMTVVVAITLVVGFLEVSDRLFEKKLARQKKERELARQREIPELAPEVLALTEDKNESSNEEFNDLLIYLTNEEFEAYALETDEDKKRQMVVLGQLRHQETALGSKLDIDSDEDIEARQEALKNLQTAIRNENEFTEAVEREYERYIELAPMLTMKTKDNFHESLKALGKKRKDTLDKYASAQLRKEQVIDDLRTAFYDLYEKHVFQFEIWEPAQRMHELFTTQQTLTPNNIVDLRRLLNMENKCFIAYETGRGIVSNRVQLKPHRKTPYTVRTTATARRNVGFMLDDGSMSKSIDLYGKTHVIKSYHSGSLEIQSMPKE